MPRTKSLAIFDAGLQVPTGAGAGKVLTSDASGNGSWAAAGAAAEYAIYADTGATIAAVNNTWTLLPVGALTKSTSADACFTVNADGTITILQTGWYEVQAEVTNPTTALTAGTDVSVKLWLSTTDVTPASPYGTATIARQDGKMTTTVQTLFINLGVAYPLQASSRIGIAGYHRDTVTPRNLACMRFSIARVTAGPQGPAGVGLIPLVTALPGSPADGDQIYFQTAAMATAGIMWQLRYVAAIADAYKWVFIGGAPWANDVATAENLSAGTTWGNLPTNGPQVTVPLQGIYAINFGARLLSGSRNTTMLVGVAVGDTTPSLPYLQMDAPDSGTPYATAMVTSAAGRNRMTVSAGNVLKHRYYATLGTGGQTFAYRWMDITPVRVG